MSKPSSVILQGERGKSLGDNANPRERVPAGISGVQSMVRMLPVIMILRVITITVAISVPSVVIVAPAIGFLPPFAAIAMSVAGHVSFAVVVVSPTTV